MSELPAWPWSFEKLHVRYRLTARLEALTGLRVGAGKQSDAAATDQPVIRDAMGRPFLPGSSLKGALRSGLESVLRALPGEGLSACDLFAAPCIESRRDAGKSKDLPLQDVLAKSCNACLLFGSPSIAGRVFVRDAALVDSAFFHTELRDGVGIDRELGTARSKIKYDTEVVPVGSFFELEIRIDNVDELHLALVLLALDLLHRGDIRIGGMTTRGLGRVALLDAVLEKSTREQILLGEKTVIAKSTEEGNLPGEKQKEAPWLDGLDSAKATLREHLSRTN